ncbi:hypothetical protein D9M71_447420 [compost metagenome]
MPAVDQIAADLAANDEQARSLVAVDIDDPAGTVGHAAGLAVDQRQSCGAGIAARPRDIDGPAVAEGSDQCAVDQRDAAGAAELGGDIEGRTARHVDGSGVAGIAGDARVLHEYPGGVAGGSLTGHVDIALVEQGAAKADGWSSGVADQRDAVAAGAALADLPTVDDAAADGAVAQHRQAGAQGTGGADRAEALVDHVAIDAGACRGVGHDHQTCARQRRTGAGGGEVAAVDQIAGDLRQVERQAECGIAAGGEVAGIQQVAVDQRERSADAGLQQCGADGDRGADGYAGGGEGQVAVDRDTGQGDGGAVGNPGHGGAAIDGQRFVEGLVES